MNEPVWYVIPYKHAHGDRTFAHETWHAATDYPIPDSVLKLTTAHHTP